MSHILFTLLRRGWEHGINVVTTDAAMYFGKSRCNFIGLAIGKLDE
ncbi:hypothetical protein MGWOODY_XGa2943 [hydrothermal vent metagenome]|uniref:Uncharacterized protein n=1 Tax=hydrothermal vent metagenome TaxID=652676 RepID=A0A160TPR9_9ZZZZ